MIRIIFKNDKISQLLQWNHLFGLRSIPMLLKYTKPMLHKSKNMNGFLFMVQICICPFSYKKNLSLLSLQLGIFFAKWRAVSSNVLWLAIDFVGFTLVSIEIINFCVEKIQFQCLEQNTAYLQALCFIPNYKTTL